MVNKSLIFLSLLWLLSGCTASLYVGTECKANDPWSHLPNGPGNADELLDQITAIPNSGHYLGKHMEWYRDDGSRLMACFHGGDSCMTSRVYFESGTLVDVEPMAPCP